MTQQVEFLLELLKILGYVGGGFLIAFRVARYYIKRDQELKSENAEMKNDIVQLKEKIDVLIERTDETPLLKQRVGTLENNYRELLRQLSEISNTLTQVRLDLGNKVNR